MNLQSYIKSYKEDLPFTLTQQLSYEFCGIRIAVDVYTYKSIRTYREFARLHMEKGNFRYDCECIDQNDWEDFLFPITLDGQAYLLFRKTLYGFTLLDPETLAEVCDYFPEKVLGGDESFIITSAATFGKYLIFDGCYWGSPYQFFAYDHVQKQFVNLSKAYGILAGDYPAKVDDSTLTLKGDSMDYAPMEVTITEPDLDRLMIEQGTTDF